MIYDEYISIHSCLCQILYHSDLEQMLSLGLLSLVYIYTYRHKCLKYITLWKIKNLGIVEPQGV